jgi:hypothetical protein
MRIIGKRADVGGGEKKCYEIIRLAGLLLKYAFKKAAVEAALKQVLFFRKKIQIFCIRKTSSLWPFPKTLAWLTFFSTICDIFSKRDKKKSEPRTPGRRGWGYPFPVLWFVPAKNRKFCIMAVDEILRRQNFFLWPNFFFPKQFA